MNVRGDLFGSAHSTNTTALGPVIQSIVSLTTSLRGQLVKYFTTSEPNTLKFFVEKVTEAFALHVFQQRIITYFRLYM